MRYYFRVNQSVWYRGDFGSGARVPGIVVGLGEKNGAAVYDVQLDDAGVDVRWGYEGQLSPRT